MAIGYGFEGVAQLRESTTWGTASTPTAVNQLYILSEAINSTPTSLADDSLGGSALRRRMEKGEERFEGSLSMYLAYGGLDTIFWHLMGDTGTGNTSPGRVGSTVAYYNEYVLKDDLDTYMSTLIIEKGVVRDNYASVKINSVTFNYVAGQRTTIEVGVICDDLALSGTALSTSGTEPTYNRSFVLPGHADIQMAAANTTVMSTANRIYPQSLSITFNNNLRGDITTRRGTLIDEPHRDGHMDISGTIQWPVYGSGTEQAAAGQGSLDPRADFLANSLMKLAVIFKGAAVGTESLFIILLFPQIQIVSEGQRASGAARITAPHDFVASRAVTALTPGQMLTEFAAAGDLVDSTRITAAQALPWIYRLNDNSANGNFVVGT